MATGPAARFGTAAPRARSAGFPRWEHEHLNEAIQARLNANPDLMRIRRRTAEHPFGTIKARIGATHFQMRRCGTCVTEMALHVLAYNITRAMNLIGAGSLLRAIAT